MSDPEPKAGPNPAIKLAVELGPILVFFFVYSKWGIFAATGTFMVTSVLALGYSWMTERRLPPMPLITAVVVLVFGGLTLVLKDETFIKVKLTIINGLFGGTLLVGALLGKPLVKHLLGEALQLADRGWQLVTRLWIGYFFTIAGINEVVWRNTTTDTWVKFKTFALPVLTVLFFLCLAPIIAKYDVSEKEEPTPEA
ncbi:MAG: septation protein A [Planctomycetota bacterium]